VSTLVLCGLVSNGCVRATCLGGMELGYRVILAADAHSSWRRETAQIIASVNAEMLEQGAEVLPAGAIC